MTASHTVRPVKPKSSPDARKLLWAIYKQEGSWPKVTRRLGLTNSGTAWKMAHGQLHDTAEMKAVLKLARARRERAFVGIRVDRQAVNIEREIARAALADIEHVQRKLKSLAIEESDHE